MNRLTSSQLDVLASRLSEAERVLQRQLTGTGYMPAQRPWVRRLARVITSLFVAQTLLAGAPAYAQLTAAPFAPTGQKPLIDAAANGTPIVHIAPPSQAGVSRNHYEQFNVGNKGLILNNSTGSAQTQTGGWINGNLQLGLTPARIILNEVTGGQASQLRGTIEVGGQKADIVIANPNGITCDGCGFLNSNRATLTTGTPHLDATGGIGRFDVRKGLINIGPDGLNATEQQQLDLYARGMVIEGEVYSQNFQAVIGANKVVYGTLSEIPQSTPHEGAGEAPRFAIDIKAMGGMYAGQIYLIATEKGLGVNSLGRSATLTGNMVLSANGDLALKDTFSSADARLASTGKMVLTGQTQAHGSVTIDAPEQLTNSGVLQAPTLHLNTPRIDNSGSMAQTAPAQNLSLVLPGGLNNSGQIYTPGDLTVQAATVSSGGTQPGQLLAGGSMHIEASSLQLTGQGLAANGEIGVRAQTLTATGGSMTAGGDVTLDASGKLDVTGTTVTANSQVRLSGSQIALDGARVGASGQVQIASAGAVTADASDIGSNSTLSVQGSRVELRSATITGVISANITASGELKLDGSRMTSGRAALKGTGIGTDGATVTAGTISIDAGTGALDNRGGKVQASSTTADAMIVRAAGINNQSGELRANGGLILDARGGLIDNTDGIIAGTSGTLTHLNGLTNRGGTLYTQSDLNLAGFALDNTAGAIVTGGQLTVVTPGQAINNTAGLLQALGTISLDSGSADLKNAGGTVVAGGGLTVNAHNVDTARGALVAGGAMAISATQLQASGATLASTGAMNIATSNDIGMDGATLNAGGDLTVQSTAVRSAGANIASTGDVQVTADSMQGGNWSAQGNLTVSSRGSIDVTNGALLAGGNVKAQGEGITTSNAQVSGRSVILQAGSGALTNVGGHISATGTIDTALAVTANGIDNSGGTLTSAAGATLNAGARTLDNTDGKIHVAGNLLLQASQLLNRGGSLSTASSLNIQGVALDNTGGLIQTQGSLTIDTAGQFLSNADGTLASGGNISLHAGDLDNSGGTISAAASTSVKAITLDADGGRISGKHQLDLVVSDALSANGATLATEGTLKADARNIAAPSVTIQAGKNLTMTATDTLDIRDATISAQGPQAGDVQISAATISAGNATISSGAGVLVRSAGGVDMNAAKVTALKSLTVQAGAGLNADAAVLKTNEQLTLSGVGIVATNASIGAVNNVSLNSNAGDLSARNVLVQSHFGNIDVRAANISAAGSTPLGATPVTGFVAGQAVSLSSTGSLDVSSAATSAATDVVITAGGDITNISGRITAGRQVDLTGAALNNQSGIVDANSAVNISVSTGEVVNDQGRISTRDVLAMSAPAGPLTSLSNKGGLIDTLGALDVRVQGFDNEGGRVTALAGLSISGGAVNSVNGLLAAEGDVSIDTHDDAFIGDGGQVLSTQGHIAIAAGAATLGSAQLLAARNMTLTAAAAVAAEKVTIAAGASATVSAAQGIDFNQGSVEAENMTLNAGSGTLNNTSGRLVASGTTGTALTLQSHGMSNDGGTIASNAGLSINAGSGNLGNAAGSMLAVGEADIRSTGLSNVGGVIASNGNLTIDATQANAGAATDSTDGTLRSGQSISLKAGATTLANATVTSGSGTTLITDALRAGQARVNVGGDLSVTASGAVTAGQIAIASGGVTSIVAGQGIDVNRGSVSARTLHLDAGAGVLNNNSGSLIASATTGTAMNLQSQGLANDAGAIVSGASLSINAGAGSAGNASGSILAVGTADIRSTGLDNRAGTIASNGDLNINAAQANANTATDSTGGTIQSGQSITLTAGATTLAQAALASGGHTTLNTGDLLAGQAQISVQGDFSATSTGMIEARQSTIAAGGRTVISAAHGIDVSSGSVAAQTVAINAGSGLLNNNSGSIQSDGAVDIQSTGLDNRSGTIVANDDITVDAALAHRGSATDSTDGVIRSAQNISVTAGDTTLTDAVIASGGSTTLTTGELQANQVRIDAEGNFVATVDGAANLGRAAIATAGGATITATRGIDVNHGAVSAQTVNLDAGSGLLNNTAGHLAAGATTGALTLRSQGLANEGGSVESAASLYVNAGAGNLANLSGSIVALGSADVLSTGLNNVDGTIASNGALTVNAAQANAATRTDNTGGTLRSAESSLSLTTGELLNSKINIGDDGSVIRAATDLTISAAGAVDNTRSEISGGNDVRITATGAFSNVQARVIAGRDVNLSASAVGNTSGLIAGNRDSTVSAGAGGVTNTSGTVQAANNLALVSAGAVINTNGQLLAGNQLDLTGGALANSQGQISAQTGNATLAVTSYSNDGGVAVAGGALSLNTQGGDLSANGSTFTSGGAMSLHGGATQINGASITAGGSIDAQFTSLQANRADVQAAGSLSVSAGTGAFSADSSNWQAGQSLALSGGRFELNNATLSANTSVAVTGSSINAGLASITSPGDVSVVALSGALNIAGASVLAGRDLVAAGTGAGVTTGAQVLAGRDLTLGNGAFFDFAAPDLQYQFGRDLTVRAQGISTDGQQVSARNLTLDAGTGQLTNQSGTLQATGDLSVSGTGLSNQGGVIAAIGAVTANAGPGTLNNEGGQIYSTQGSVDVSGAGIQNTTGIVSAATDVAISGGMLNNAGNTITAGGNLTVDMSGAVNNAGGRLIANSGSATVSANGIHNQLGIISGATDTTAHAGSGTLSNTGGVVTGQDVIIGGEVQNSSGVISGSNSVTMTTRALNNDAGVIESGASGISIDTQGHTLTNTNSGSTRGIVSAGGISIAAGDIDNRAGYIGASGSLSITQATGVSNQGGTLLALDSSAIVTSGTLNNEGGRILVGDNLAIKAEAVNNSNAGTIYAGQELTIGAASIDNSNTRNADYTTGLLAGGSAYITAGTVNNTNGAIVALGTTGIRATGSLNNTQGQIAGGTVSIETPILTNTTGRADARQNMTLKVSQFSADGVLASNGALNLQLQGDYTNTGTVGANGDLTITTTGSYTNQGRVSAQDSLSLTATGIDNQVNAIIDSKVTTLNAGGAALNNAGLINSTQGQTTLSAGTLNNTGRIYGDSITITAATNNTQDASGAGAVIASRGGDVTINGQLNNTSGGMVLSLGNLRVNGSVLNTGSQINAARDLTITGTLTNANAGFTTGTQTRSEPAAGLFIRPSGSTTEYNAATLGWNPHTGGHYVLPSTTYPFASFGSDYKQPAVQCGHTGGDAGDWTCSYVYSTSDPVWALMGVTSPGPAPADMSSGCMDFGGETGNAQRITSDSCGTYWSSYDAYQSSLSGAYALLDGAIATFNTDLDSRMLIDWYETTTTDRTITETMVTSSSPGYVLAGGNMNLGGGTNTDSVIIAGGDVVANGLRNVASKGTRETDTNGTWVFSHRTWSGGFSRSYGREVSEPQPLADAPVTTEFDLPILRYQANGNPSAPAAGGTSTPVAGAVAIVPAAGVGTVDPRGTNLAANATGITQSGTPAAGGAGAVQVASTTTDQPQIASGVSTVQTQAGAAVNTGTANGPAVSDTNVVAGEVNAPSAVNPGDAGAGPAIGDTTVGATPGTGTTAPAVSLNDAPDQPLPGSIIAGGLRAGQLAIVTATLKSFAMDAAALPIAATPADTSARLATPVPVKAAGYTTVQAAGQVSAPNNQLFTLNLSPRGPLVETDPAFTGYRSWISSAYMQAQLAMDPERTMNLYGDGFAEQRLIDDQIMALTGRRYLSGYSSTEEEYQALMEAGVMYARQFQLTPGLALSAEQMAALTTDIVWLEAKAVTLPDGSTVQALVPTVYLRRPIAGDLTPTGALIAGSNVTLRSPGDLANSGTIFAHGEAAEGNGRLTIVGANVANTGTLAGNVISVGAQETINNAGGAIQGLGQGSSAVLNARDIILRTTTQTRSATTEGPNGTSTGTRTNVDRIATVSAGSVRLAALNNISLQGASVKAAGDLTVTAGGTITSEAVKTGYTSNVPMGGGGAQGRSSYYDLALTQQQLTTLSGNNVAIAAIGDASFKGTDVTALNDLSISAANINLEAVKNSVAIVQQGVNKKGFELVGNANETLVGGVFKAGNNATLTATAGNLTATGAIIAAASGAATLSATGNVVIQNATTLHSTQAESYNSSRSLLRTHTKTGASSSELTRVEGGSVSGNTVAIRAGNDVTIQASQVNAAQALTVRAGNDVNITTAQQLLDTSSARTDAKTASGLAVGLAIGLAPAIGHLGVAVANSSRSAGQGSSESSTAIGSTLTGASVTIQSGRDTTVQGSTVIADQDLAITAGRNLAVVSAQDTAQAGGTSSSKDSGSIGSTWQPAIGVAKQTSGMHDSSTTQVGSTIASLGGNVTLKAGALYTQTASDVIALQGDASISAKKIIINEAQDTAAGSQQSQNSRTAIGGSVSVPLVDAIRTIGNVAQAAGDTGNGRVQALAAATAALSAKAAVDSAAQLAAGNLGGIKVSVSLGSSKSESQGTQASSTVVGSNVLAKGVTLTSTGDGASSSIAVTGSNIAATDRATLKADGKVILQAGTNTAEQHSTHGSSGWSVGVGFALGGGQNGFSLDASASKSRGNADGTDITYTNSHLTAGNTVTIQSGGDTVLKGAVVQAHQVTGSIGGKLIVESLQDTSTYDSKQTSSGAGVSLCIPPFCYGMSTVAGGSVSAGKTNIDGTYRSVTEQSGIKTGDDGFNVSVGGDTVLVGGIIASTDSAVQEGKNIFTPGGLVIATDLYNSASTDANGYSITAGVGTQLSSSKAGIGQVEHSASSTTSAGISGIAGNTAVRSTDAPSGIGHIHDADQVARDIHAQIAVTGAFGRAAVPVAASYADQQAVNARRAGNEQEARKWDEGGAYRVSMYAGLGFLSGDASGAAGAAASASLIPSIGEEIAGMNLPEAVRQGLTQITGLAVGAAVGGTAGGTAAQIQTALNYVSHSPFASVKRAVSQQNAVLLNQCGAVCTLEDLRRFDAHLAQLEAAATFSLFAQQGRQLTTEQGTRIAQIALELSPFGTPESIAQLLTGQESLSGDEANRFWAAIGVIPLAGGGIKLLGKALDGGVAFIKAATQGEHIVLNSYTLSKSWADASGNLIWRNPLTNAVEVLPAGSKVHVDHVLPRAEFYNMPGFDKLPADVQEKLINDPANLQPMIGSANCSKGCKVEYGGGWMTWNGQPVSAEYSKQLRLVQDRIVLKVEQELSDRGFR